MDRVCPVDGCTKAVLRGDFCYAHYMKNWRYGTPTPAHGAKWKDIRGHRFGALVVIRREGSKWLCICDCRRTRVVSAGDLNRYSEESTCGDKKQHRRTDDAGYGAAHDRVRRDRGNAKDYACIDCGAQARHWAYDHADPDELIAEKLGAYSLDPGHYDPRCVPCHKRFDLDHINAAELVREW